VDAAVDLVRCLTSSSVRQVFMNREMTVSSSLQKAIKKERSIRRGGALKWNLTLKTSEDSIMMHNESVRSSVPSRVS